MSQPLITQIAVFLGNADELYLHLMCNRETAFGFPHDTGIWWRHQMETFSALLAICASEFPAQGPVTRSFDVFIDLHPNKLLSKQPWGWWFETPSYPLWRHRNETFLVHDPILVTHLVDSSQKGLVNRDWLFSLLLVWNKLLNKQFSCRELKCRCPHGTLLQCSERISTTCRILIWGNEITFKNTFSHLKNDKLCHLGGYYWHFYVGSTLLNSRNVIMEMTLIYSCASSTFNSLLFYVSLVMSFAKVVDSRNATMIKTFEYLIYHSDGYMSMITLYPTVMPTKIRHLDPFLLRWVNFNPIMDK